MTLRTQLRLFVLVVSLCTWGWTLPRLFEASHDHTQELLNAQLEIITDPAKHQASMDRLRGINAEWDFMQRTFLVLALTNLALEHQDQRDEYLKYIDRIIQDTLEIERTQGQLHFLMPYGRSDPFIVQPARSLFVDGEILISLGARLLIQSDQTLLTELQSRAQEISDRMQLSPVRCVESYPNECWTFCHSVAIAGLEIASILTKNEPSAVARRWIDSAKIALRDPATSLLVSRYTPAGEILEGPEGSSLWTAAHFINFVDPQFAQEQYRLARGYLSDSLFGFGYAREWPAVSSRPGFSLRWPRADLDSGPMVPILDASAGSSGQAILGAATFADRNFSASLLRSLNFVGFSRTFRTGRGATALMYDASNAVGDAVLLYAGALGMSQGPLIRELTRRLK